MLELPEWTKLAVEINRRVARVRDRAVEGAQDRRDRLFREKALRKAGEVLRGLPDKVAAAARAGQGDIVLLTWTAGDGGKLFRAAAALLERYFKDRNIRSQNAGHNFSVDLQTLLASASWERG